MLKTSTFLGKDKGGAGGGGQFGYAGIRVNNYNSYVSGRLLYTCCSPLTPEKHPLPCFQTSCTASEYFGFKI